MIDTAMLNALQAKATRGYWVCRRSKNDRGLRVQEISREEAERDSLSPCLTIQGAIAAFLEAEKNRPA